LVLLLLVLQGKLVSAADSAAKCVRIVLSQTYTSGTHIDFFDPDGPAAEAPAPA
jgi:hypothetical protein